MRFDYKSVLQNRYILYLFFIIILLQLVVFLNIGEFQYVAILLVSGALVSRFNKNMIIVLFSALIITHLVKLLMNVNSFGMREGLENSSASGTTSTASMSSQDIKQTIQEQEEKKKEIQNEINSIYLNNKKEIANLEVVLKEAQAAQASIPST